MGQSQAKPKFNTLDYPSYCTLDPATYDDQMTCYESWTRAVRTRTADDDFAPEDRGKKSFDVLKKKFENYMQKQGATEALPPDFLVCLVGTLVHGKIYRAAAFRSYGLKAATWSAVGTSLFMSVFALHHPFVWSADIQAAWTRCFGELMRAILEIPSVIRMSPSASRLPIPRYPPRHSGLRIDIPAKPKEPKLPETHANSI